MSTIDLGTFWQALQSVDDGEDPADVYARITGEPTDPDFIDELIEDGAQDDLENLHNHPSCLTKHQHAGVCMGNECVAGGNGLRMNLQCPCKCHEGGYPWN